MNDNFVFLSQGWLAKAYQRKRETEFIVSLVARSFSVTFGLISNLLAPHHAEEGVIALGRQIDEFGQEKQIIGLLDSELRKHIHIIGGTGRGKTTLLVNMAIQLITLKRAIVIIDPKGDLVDSIMRFIPQEHLDNVILLDPTDREYPLAFNVFESVPVEERSRVAGEILLIFKKITAQGSWGPRLESILRLAILALLEVPGSTLLDLYYFLIDEAFRSAALQRVTDTFVKEFWVKQYSTMSDSQKQTAISPILNKIEPWLTYQEARFALGQAISSFSLRSAIDTGKVVLIRIPQGILGEDLSSLLGALMVTKLQMEVMSRAAMPISQRPLVHLLVDEFQNFTTSSFEKILAEARSFGLSIVCANQFAGQLPQELMMSLENNCAARLTCHMDDNKHLLQLELLQDINVTEFWIRPLLPAQKGSDENARSIRYMSQLKYGTEVQDVIAQIELKHQLRNRLRPSTPLVSQFNAPKTTTQPKIAQVAQTNQPTPAVMQHGKRKNKTQKT